MYLWMLKAVEGASKHCTLNVRNISASRLHIRELAKLSFQKWNLLRGNLHGHWNARFTPLISGLRFGPELRSICRKKAAFQRTVTLTTWVNKLSARHWIQLRYIENNFVNTVDLIYIYRNLSLNKVNRMYIGKRTPSLFYLYKSFITKCAIYDII